MGWGARNLPHLPDSCQRCGRPRRAAPAAAAPQRRRRRGRGRGRCCAPPAPAQALHGWFGKVRVWGLAMWQAIGRPADDELCNMTAIMHFTAQRQARATTHETNCKQWSRPLQPKQHPPRMRRSTAASQPPTPSHLTPERRGGVWAVHSPCAPAVPSGDACLARLADGAWSGEAAAAGDVQPWPCSAASPSPPPSGGAAAPAPVLPAAPSASPLAVGGGGCAAAAAAAFVGAALALAAGSDAAAAAAAGAAATAAAAAAGTAAGSFPASRSRARLLLCLQACMHACVHHKQASSVTHAPRELGWLPCARRTPHTLGAAARRPPDCPTPTAYMGTITPLTPLAQDMTHADNPS